MGKKKVNSKGKMTLKQERFCREYLVDLNATQAAMRAGYSVKTAHTIGQENLRKPVIKAYLSDKIQKQSEKTSITVEEILKELKNFLMFDPAKMYDEDGNIKPLHEMDEATRKSICGHDVKEHITESVSGDSMEVKRISKIKTWDKLKSAELLGKYLKMFDGNTQEDDTPKVSGFTIEVIKNDKD